MDQEKLKKECISLIDEVFYEYENTAVSGNSIQKFSDRTKLAIKAVKISEKVCNDFLLNTLSVKNAKTFAETGFCNNYILQKAKDLIKKT